VGIRVGIEVSYHVAWKARPERSEGPAKKSQAKPSNSPA